jgi:uncharacterized protein YqjF (DUF2071 family)
MPSYESIPDAHRPWPAPRSPWLLRQVWNHVLFAHWRFPAEPVRATLPPPLQPHLDTYDGDAWIGIVAFRATGTRMHDLPPVPGASNLNELNVRTYITIDGKPGVYFYSLDTFHLLAVAGARLFYRLPYFPARTEFTAIDRGFHYTSHRLPPGEAEFDATYAPVGDPRPATEHPLTAFLAERYCLYTAGEHEMGRAEILHRPWPLSPAQATIRRNTMLTPLGLELPAAAPLCHYAPVQDTLIWPPATSVRTAPARRS